ncbi:type II toxin-antitoxin system VapC family toxin [Candidatus Woesearchaeota archaeon]|nr:MAG: type II toxin-antitoxin system VapC family toxin [Candidatus Woesearchaeota archaeon]
MICLDTSFLIDILKNDLKAVRKLREYTGRPLCSTAINYFELVLGANMKGYAKEAEQAKSMFSQLSDVLLLDTESAEAGAKILARLAKKGETIGQNDCLIAGIMAHNRVKHIITRNKKDFSKIQGISVIDY